MKRHWKFITALGVSALFVTEAAAEMTWNVSVWGKRRAFTEGVHRLAEVVEQRTNGEWKFNISYGGLSKSRENLDGISIGAFEMAQTCILYHPSKVPAYTALDLPFLGIASVRQQGAFELEMQKHPALAADLAKWSAVAVMPAPQTQYNLVGTGDAMAGIDDLSGMRVRAGGVIGEAMAKLGAVPTPLSATEVYNALDSGVIDAVAFADHAHLAYRTGEIGNWWTTNLNPGAASCPFVVNMDALDSLSDEQKAIFQEAIPEAMEHYYQSYEKMVSDWGAFVDEKGLTRVTLSDEAVARIKDATAPMHQEWIEKQTEAGRPGQEIYDAVIEAVATTAGK